MIKVKHNDTELQFQSGITLDEISKTVQNEYSNPIILAYVNGKIVELFKKAKNNDRVSFITTEDKIGYSTYRRTCLFIMIKAAFDVFNDNGQTHIKVQYSIGTGLYCELYGGKKINKTLLGKIKKRMKELIAANMPITRTAVNTEDAYEIFKKEKLEDKLGLIERRLVSSTTLYSLGGYDDYFYGKMGTNTGAIKEFDLFLYDEGFILNFPTMKDVTHISDFTIYEKLFGTLKQSERWATMLGIETVSDLNTVIENGDINDIILVQEAILETRIGEIAEKVKEGGKRIVMIAGPSSSGKTTFSHRLSIQLRAHGITPHPIPVDDYFRNREDTPLDENGKPDIESVNAVDIIRLNHDLKALLKGETVDIPTFDFVTGKRSNKTRSKKIGPEDVLVIEGIHCLNDALTSSIDASEKFKIYISALTQLNIDDHNRIPTTDGRLLRRIVRDAANRGHSAAMTINMWDAVRKGEEKNIFPFQEKADVMFNSSMIFEFSVLKQCAEPLLQRIKPDEPEYEEARRLLKFLAFFQGISSECVPYNSIIREFIGGSYFDV